MINIIESDNRQWDVVYSVPSHSNPNTAYTVVQTVGEFEMWACSCPAWIYHFPRRDCKHIREAKEWLAQNKPTPVRPPTAKEVKAISRFSLIEID
jgi:hypothetical protein